MFKLIRLEIRKFKLQDSIKGIILTTAISLGIVLLIVLSSKSEAEIQYKNFADLIVLIDSIVRGCFIIFISVILSKLVIDEYKNKTINLMFMYPIKRKNIFVAKFVIVSLMTFVSVIISNFLLIAIFYLANQFIAIVPNSLNSGVDFNIILRLVVNALVASCIVLIPLFFGMKKKSTPATMLSAVLIGSVICSSNTSSIPIIYYMAISMLLGALGIYIV